MTLNLSDSRGPSTSPRLEIQPSGRYIDMRFYGASESGYPQTEIEEYHSGDSEDFIDMIFPRESEEIQDVEAKSGTLLTRRFKVMRFPRVSEDILKVDIEDFYTSLKVGLDSLQRLADSDFLSADFLVESIKFLKSVISDARTLVEKLTDLRHPSSVEVRETVAEYNCVSGKILNVCNALKFSMTLLKAYQNSQVESAVTAAEALVDIPGSSPRVMHVSQANKALVCFEACRSEMVQMQLQVKNLVESGCYGSLSYKRTV